MPHYPILPVRRAEELNADAIDDMKAAIRTFCATTGGMDHFDKLVTHPESVAILHGLFQGTIDGCTALARIRRDFLSKVSATRSLTERNTPNVERALAKAASLLALIPWDVSIDCAGDAQIDTVVRAFATLYECKGVAGTVASKIIAPLRPNIVIIWDTPIAAAYGFAHSPEGYWRFLRLMRDVAQRLRILGGDHDLELLLKPLDRKWKAPLAKCIDEWHWVRLTKDPAAETNAKETKI
jgi:hypothetical protein